MRFCLLLMLAAILNFVNGRALHERIRRVARSDYNPSLDKTPSDHDYYISDDDGEYIYGDYEDYDEFEMFTCFAGDEEVAITVMCDGYADCPDGSDEVANNCEEHGVTTVTTTTTATTTTTTTTTTATTTETPQTVKPSVREPEDYDYEDACTEKEFQCASDPSICLPRSQVCDGIHDCPEKEDEVNCTENAFKTILTTTVTSLTSSAESSKRERNLAERKQRPSTNISAIEISCSSIHAFQCRSRPGDCVPRRLLCDGFYDCPDGSDEERCTCRTGEYACVNGNCVDATTRCNGANDCGDFSDEIIGCVLFLPRNPGMLDKRANEEERTEPIQNTTTALPAMIATTLREGKSLKLSSKNTTLDEKTTTMSMSEVQPTISSNNEFQFLICSLHPCANEGECYENHYSFICVCKSGYKGPTCLQKSTCEKGDPDCNSSTDTKAFRTSFSTILSIFIFVFFL